MDGVFRPAADPLNIKYNIFWLTEMDAMHAESATQLLETSVVI